ncbi:MAG: 2-C-methyl-D-erythritol 2,4-cyclodiphosphate synthase [Oscillospiraceae bacterium]
MRIGFGYDVHALVENRKLILGGVIIPFKHGLLGHSDADVLVHAIMDALLGAAALGDIGKHFPDTDQKYKNADSLNLLSSVKALLDSHDYIINNIDATIVAQAPKLSPYMDKMIQNIASCLSLSTTCLNIKATTTEHLGFEGRGDGISAYAVCTIKNSENS